MTHCWISGRFATVIQNFWKVTTTQGLMNPYLKSNKSMEMEIFKTTNGNRNNKWQNKNTNMK